MIGSAVTTVSGPGATSPPHHYPTEARLVRAMFALGAPLSDIPRVLALEPNFCTKAVQDLQPWFKPGLHATFFPEFIALLEGE